MAVVSVGGVSSSPVSLVHEWDNVANTMRYLSTRAYYPKTGPRPGEVGCVGGDWDAVVRRLARLVWDNAWIDEAEEHCRRTGKRMGEYLAMTIPPMPADVLEEVCIHLRGWYATHRIDRDLRASISDCVGAMFANIYGHGSHPGDGCFVPSTDGLTEECLAASDAAYEWFQRHAENARAV